MSDAAEVMRQLDDWRRGCRRFLRIYRGHEITARDSAGCDIRVYQVREVTGRIVTVPVVHVWSFRWRVLRLARMARRRYRAKDWDWFHWLREMRELVIWDLRDDFDELYGPVIETAIKRKAQLKKATAAAAVTRREHGTEKKNRVLRGDKNLVSSRHERRMRRGK